jgi:hypothetical protein
MEIPISERSSERLTYMPTNDVKERMDSPEVTYTRETIADGIGLLYNETKNTYLLNTPGTTREAPFSATVGPAGKFLNSVPPWQDIAEKAFKKLFK